MPSDTVPILSVEERAALVEEHSPADRGSDAQGRPVRVCDDCGDHFADVLWPCDLRRALATCDALERERSEMIATFAQQLRDMEGLFRPRLERAEAALREIVGLRDHHFPESRNEEIAEQQAAFRFVAKIARRALDVMAKEGVGG